MKSNEDRRGIRVRPFFPEHLEFMDIADEHLAGLGEIGENLGAELLECESYTVTDKGRIIAITGVQRLWKGVWSVFIVPSIYLPESGMGFIWAVRMCLNTMQKTRGIHRFQTFSQSDPVISRFMAAIGFLQEGTAKMYSSDRKDYILWAKTWDSVGQD